MHHTNILKRATMTTCFDQRFAHFTEYDAIDVLMNMTSISDEIDAYFEIDDEIEEELDAMDELYASSLHWK
jgi:hypothetical protein